MLDVSLRLLVHLITLFTVLWPHQALVHLHKAVNGLGISVISSMNERCPYRYKYQFVQWLVKYKGWKQSDANKLTIKQCYGIYYAS